MGALPVAAPAAPRGLQAVRAWWRRFRIRLGSWEYWPMHLVYAPVYAYWAWLGIRARRPMFFAAANPVIPFGGLFGDSKGDILDRIPAAWKPATLRIPAGSRPETVLAAAAAAGLHFPLIAKPDLGERGLMVEKLADAAALRAYWERPTPEMLLQAYIDEPVEVGVLYYRLPGASQGTISSVTLKEFLAVTGDGRHTVADLMAQDPRATLQLPVLQAREPALMATVPAAGQRVELMPIGNHCRGTTFLDGRHEIDAALVARFDAIVAELPGIAFGRFDIRCRSLDALRAGHDFYILEINGVKAEPTHIYQPGFPLREAYRVLFRQWNTIYQIAQAHRQAGVTVPSLWTGIQTLRRQNAYRKRWA